MLTITKCVVYDIGLPTLSTIVGDKLPSTIVTVHWLTIADQ